MSRRHAPSRRLGFTLGEMLIALVLFSLVGGAIISLVTRQQRFYRATAEIISLQGRLRQGASMLPLDLRGISTADTTANGVSPTWKANNYNADVYSRTDKSIEFRRIFGSSMVCAKPVTGATSIMIYPVTLDSVAAITTWANQPAVGDSILVVDEGKFMGTLDDTWRAYEITGVAQAKGNKGCPWKTSAPVDSSPLLYGSDTVRISYRIAISPGVSPYVSVGSIVRFFRRVRYEAYQAADGRWYLGYSDCLKTYATASKCSDLTPVSGPYEPYTGVASTNGITFTYYDSSGTLLGSTDPSRRIARVNVMMRTASATAVTRTGAGAGTVYRDSVLLTVGIRNRR